MREIKLKLPEYGDGQYVTSVVSHFVGKAIGDLGYSNGSYPIDYCPPEISEILNFYLEKAYNKGVMDMHRSMQDLIFETMSHPYEHSLDYSYGQYKEDKENEDDIQ